MSAPPVIGSRRAASREAASTFDRLLAREPAAGLLEDLVGAQLGSRPAPRFRAAEGDDGRGAIRVREELHHASWRCDCRSGATARERYRDSLDRLSLCVL